MKVGTLAPLGLGVEVDADTGRERLAWGRASYGAGFEEAPAFWGRAHVEACRRERGTPAVRTVVALGDGAEWIWRHARAYLALPGVEVVELIDLYHAYAYLWGVGNAVFGEGTARAAAWVEPLKTRLYTEGAAPLHAVLTTLARTVCVPTATAATESAAATAVRRAIAYVTTNPARLDYPAFMAQRFPMGSGAVESSCKSVVQARTKGAHMRWSAAGAQQVVSLRAAPLRALGRLLADPAPACPPAPVPACASCASRPSHTGRALGTRRAHRWYRPSRARYVRPPIIPGDGNPWDARGRPERTVHYFKVHPQSWRRVDIAPAVCYATRSRAA